MHSPIKNVRRGKMNPIFNAPDATTLITHSFAKQSNIKTGVSRASIFLGFWLLMLALCASASAAVLFDPCQGFLSQINGLQAERASLQAELQHAAPGEKPGLIHQIEELNSQIAKAQHD